ncbi:hypothetical protein SteCoe_31724 [Stentor coeruleus]|uniref:Uncharacterized protein n=1 Tax=Stentor coeruleus TaxID=5963 RepID=A0A1R2B0K2_9CILI|nr:hypothetical protein SteCoe_31724 [Stentor coeruleus]
MEEYKVGIKLKEKLRQVSNKGKLNLDTNPLSGDINLPEIKSQSPGNKVAFSLRLNELNEEKDKSLQKEIQLKLGNSYRSPMEKLPQINLTPRPNHNQQFSSIKMTTKSASPIHKRHQGQDLSPNDIRLPPILSTSKNTRSALRNLMKLHQNTNAK